jgi:hypothetical protein
MFAQRLREAARLEERASDHPGRGRDVGQRCVMRWNNRAGRFWQTGKNRLDDRQT